MYKHKNLFFQDLMRKRIYIYMIKFIKNEIIILCIKILPFFAVEEFSLFLFVL